jgi:hypothetical protein
MNGTGDHLKDRWSVPSAIRLIGTKSVNKNNYQKLNIMERGYVKLWRKSLDSPIFKNPELFYFWSYCLMKASHKKYKSLVGLTMVELEPGQFVFGRNKASIETGLSERKVRTCLKKLESFGNLTIKTTNKFSIISIINWGTYQAEKEENAQQSDQQVTSNRPTSDQQVTTNKNIKHIKNREKKDIPPTPKPKKPKKKFQPPTKDQVISYFLENEYDGNKGAEAFEFYACADWVDSRGNKVKNWKQKMRGVWFKDDNRINAKKMNGSPKNIGEQNTKTCQEWINGE